MIIEQHGRCAICPDQLTNSKETHIDHSHSTGEVRGVLCGNCNRMLGGCRDRTDILRAAIAYLDR
jgi:hypothetical protein